MSHSQAEVLRHLNVNQAGILSASHGITSLDCHAVREQGQLIFLDVEGKLNHKIHRHHGNCTKSRSCKHTALMLKTTRSRPRLSHGTDKDLSCSENPYPTSNGMAFGTDDLLVQSYQERLYNHIREGTGDCVKRTDIEQTYRRFPCKYSLQRIELQHTMTDAL